MSPILTRPVREQLEHDRVIRQLQTRYKRKSDVIINPGNEQNQSVTVGELVVFPDLLVFAEGTRRLLATVEVETGESVNPIEARAEWGVFSKLKVPLHLYVPPVCVDAVKRIAAEYQIVVSELWTYTVTFDQVRFALVYRSPDAPVVKIPESTQKAQTLKAQTQKAQAKPAQKTHTQKAQTTQRAQLKPTQKAQPKAAVKAGKTTKMAQTKAKPVQKAAKSKPVAKPKAKATANKKKR